MTPTAELVKDLGLMTVFLARLAKSWTLTDTAYAQITIRKLVLEFVHVHLLTLFTKASASTQPKLAGRTKWNNS